MTTVVEVIKQVTFEVPGSGGGAVDTVTGDETTIHVDNTDPTNPIVSSLVTGNGGSGTVESVTADEVTVHIDNSDPANPIIDATPLQTTLQAVDTVLLAQINANLASFVSHHTRHEFGGPDQVNLNGSQIVAGTIADARIASTIARDSEVSAAVATETSRATAIENALDTRLDVVEARVVSLDAAVILQGSWDASAGVFPGGGTAQAGYSWITAVPGTVDGVVFNTNDRVIAIADNASTTTFADNWYKSDYTDQVLTVNGQTGVVVLDKSDIGLDQVDNTSDVNKPVSTAQAAADALKLAKASNLSDLASAPTARTNLGLGNVDNTSDANKPVSTAQATAIALKLSIASNLSDLANAATARGNLGLGNVDNTSDVNKPVSTAQAAADALAVPKSLFDANTILIADTDNTPTPLTMGASTILARLASGGIIAATTAQLKTLLAIASTDVSGLGALATLSTVGTTQIAASAVTLAKMEDRAQATVLGRKSGAGTGAPQEMTPAETATVLSTVEHTATAYKASGASAGFTQGRYLGTWNGAGPPTSGTAQQYDWCLDTAGATWVCSAAGTPGTWFSPDGGRQLALADITSAPANITAVGSASRVDVDAGLFITITVGTKPIRLHGHFPSVSNSVATNGMGFAIVEGTIGGGAGTVIEQSTSLSATANQTLHMDVIRTLTPSAGSHTYKLMGWAITGGTVAFSGASSLRAFIQAQEL